MNLSSPTGQLIVELVGYGEINIALFSLDSIFAKYIHFANYFALFFRSLFFFFTTDYDFSSKVSGMYHYYTTTTMQSIDPTMTVS